MSAAEVLNCQLHIDTFASFFKREFLIEELKTRKLDQELQQWGYCLQHKHFDLQEGEVILYTFKGSLISARIVRISEVESTLYPCVYYSFKGHFHPVGMCITKEDALANVPEHCSQLDGIGICSRSFNQGLVEYTTTDRRSHVFVPVSRTLRKTDLMITMAFANGDSLNSLSYMYCSTDVELNGNGVHVNKWTHVRIPE